MIGYTIRLRMIAITIACAAIAFGVACKKESPTAGGEGAAIEQATTARPAEPTLVSPAPVEAVALPKGVEVADGQMAAYIRLREPAKTLERAGLWAARTNPQVSGEALRGQLQMMGVDLSQLRAGGDISLFLWRPEDPNAAPKWAALLPTTADSQFTLMVKSLSQAQSEGTIGQDVLIASDPATLAAAQTAAANLEAIASSAMLTDVQAYVNVGGLMTVYGPQLRLGAMMMQSMVAGAISRSQGGLPAGDSQQLQQMLAAEITALLDGLEQVQSLTLNLDMPADAIELSMVTQAKPETTMAGILDREPVGSPNMARFLGSDHTMMLQLSLNDLQTLSDIYQKYLPMVLPADKPEVKEKLDTMLTKLVELGSLDYAFAMDPKAGQVIDFQGICQTGNPELMMQIMKDYAIFVKLEGASAVTGGMEYAMEVKEGARTVQGKPVDQYTIDLKFPEGIAADEAAMMRRMLGDGKIEMEIMRLGPSVLFSANQPIDGLAERYLSGSASGGTRAQAVFEPGAWFYYDMNAIEYLQMAMSLGDSAMASKLEGLQAPPMTMAAYHQNGSGYYRMRLPAELFDAFRAFGERMQGSAMGQAATPGGME
jgi:hypothetical protein